MIVDIGRVTATRPTVRGLIEADVTGPMQRVEEGDLSVTAFVVSTLARAIAEQPEIQALRDWRGNLVVFDDVDVTVSVEVELEGRSFPLSHIVRSAQRLSAADVTTEMRTLLETPADSPSLQHMGAARAYVALPGFVRRWALRLLYRLPDWQRKIMGTAGVSAIGMFGKGGGWGIGFPVHPVDVLVGGIEDQEATIDGQATIRRLMAITLSFDHDVVDGAPAARFASRFREMLEAGTTLTS